MSPAWPKEGDISMSPEGHCVASLRDLASLGGDLVGLKGNVTLRYNMPHYEVLYTSFLLAFAYEWRASNLSLPLANFC